jgi:type II secretory pathway pseudopilin PulG
MQRTAGIALLLVGSVLLLLGAVLLYLVYVRPLPYAIGAFLLAGVVISSGVLVLRRSGRMLGVSRPALAGAVVVAMVLVLAAIVVSTVLVGRDRRRQKETMSDLRSIAAALEERAVAQNSYPQVSAIEELRPHLTPTYLQDLPQRDHWGHPLRYEWLPDGYAIASAGRDGIWQRPRLREYPSATTQSYDDDIVFANGVFVQYPNSGPHPY